MERRPSRSHRTALKALGIGEPALSRLEAYLELVAAWSRRVNLTGARTAAARVEVLVGEVLPAAAIPAPGTLIDVGSGNGSPGLVLALLRDDLQVTLLEPRARRWAFLREAARVTRRAVAVLRTRHDGYRAAPARTVTLRAVGLPLTAIGHLVEPGGRLLLFGAPEEAGPFALEREIALPRGRLRVYRAPGGPVSRETRR